MPEDNVWLLLLLPYNEICIISDTWAVVIDWLEFECDVLVIITPPCHSSAVCYWLCYCRCSVHIIKLIIQIVVTVAVVVWCWVTELRWCKIAVVIVKHHIGPSVIIRIQVSHIQIVVSISVNVIVATEENVNWIIKCYPECHAQYCL